MSEDPVPPRKLCIREILALLPHRYPFLLVDRVLSVEPGRRVVALKNVSVNEEFFSGHFPGNPVMPGVLILEALAQAAGCMMFADDPDPSNKIAYLTGVDKARFRRPVVPGDQLLLHVELLAAKQGLVKVRAQARVEGALCVEAELMTQIREKAKGESR